MAKAINKYKKELITQIEDCTNWDELLETLEVEREVILDTADLET